MTSKQALKRALFIFRRDLRLEDNIGLQACLSAFTEVIPCFIFDEKQILPTKNAYFSNNAVQFMIESLISLDKDLNNLGSRLFFFYGEYPNIIQEIIKNLKPEAVFLNEDYSPYALSRDAMISDACKSVKIQFSSFHDATLLDKDKILLSTGAFYKKFTPYYRQASTESIKKPKKCENIQNFISKDLKVKATIEFPKEKLTDFYEENKQINVHGGRATALNLLNNVKNFSNYENTRNFPELQTTNLSAPTKFGCISIREFYWTIRDNLGSKNGEPLLRQLFWRDFYTYVLFYYPHVIKGPMKPAYAKIQWENDEKLFEAWKKGMTGFPIVDAGMRSLNETGYMHNRLRMVTSNFLIKLLLIDWRLGEKYFASKLVDYDIAQNNGGWQWSSSTGTDSQPYFRIFNPKLQSEKFDKKCKFIQKWVPELKGVLNKEHLHDWENFGSLNRSKIKTDYPESVIVYKDRKEMALNLYKKGLEGKNDELGDSFEYDAGEKKVDDKKKTKKKSETQFILGNSKDFVAKKTKK